MVDSAVGAHDAPSVADDAVAVAPPVGRSLRLGHRRYPVILPKWRDARLHVAAVVLTIHALGQVGLNFHVSVPQILAAILTTAIIGVALTFRSTGAIVWPASAMLTGSGVALILRVPTTPTGDHWTFHKWYVFAGVAAFSLMTRYVIRYRGSHLFNPSNLGLVVAFLVLGSTRVEPLDFWWAPWNVWMITAYGVILVGGLLITRRLRLLTVAATFWLGLAAGLGLLAASGHCMTARWAFAPVCGFDFWRVVVFSPEVLIFLFFMITDPKTVPAGRVGRAVFGLLVAITAVLLIAPQTTEFATKVALLGALVIVCALRPLLDRWFPADASDDELGAFASRLITGRDGTAGVGLRIARLAAVAAVTVLVGVAVLALGQPARDGVVAVDNDEILGRVPHEVNPATFPAISIDQGVLDWNHEIAGPGAQEVVLTLAENLELERQAMLRGDAAILDVVDHGDRLEAMKAALDDAVASGTAVVDRYQIDDVHVTLIVPFGVQAGLSLGLESTGTKTTETYVDGELQSAESKPFATTFVMRRATGARWLNVAEFPLDDGA